MLDERKIGVFAVVGVVKRKIPNSFAAFFLFVKTYANVEKVDGGQRVVVFVYHVVGGGFAFLNQFAFNIFSGAPMPSK